MSDNVRRLTTDDERERLRVAKDLGGLCAVCGRTLGERERVYIRRVVIGTRLFGDPRGSGSSVFAESPVGAECAPPGLVTGDGGRDPAPCVGCGRHVSHAVRRPRRGRVACSLLCRRSAATMSRTRWAAGS